MVLGRARGTKRPARQKTRLSGANANSSAVRCSRTQRSGDPHRRRPIHSTGLAAGIAAAHRSDVFVPQPRLQTRPQHSRRGAPGAPRGAIGTTRISHRRCTRLFRTASSIHADCRDCRRDPSNRRMRTRMSGGVAGERRCSVMLTVVPYADRQCVVGCGAPSRRSESRSLKGRSGLPGNFPPNHGRRIRIDCGPKVLSFVHRYIRDDIVLYVRAHVELGRRDRTSTLRCWRGAGD
jgi:hypothetical protein